MRNLTTYFLACVQGGLGNPGPASTQGGIGKFWKHVVHRLALESPSRLSYTYMKSPSPFNYFLEKTRR